MRITAKCVGLLLLLIQSAFGPVAVNAGTLDDDLSFPASPEPFGYAKASKMFKPQGSGPFPALVMLPTCAGHLSRHVFDVWAKAALQRGYAVLVVDPLTPRGVTAPGENCLPPSKVDLWRIRKDALDAARHLRKQPFVDPDRVALLGLSQGAMAALGISASLYETPQGRPAFKAIVANYPVCFLGNLRISGRPPRDINLFRRRGSRCHFSCKWATVIPRARHKIAFRGSSLRKIGERRSRRWFTKARLMAGTSEPILPRRALTAAASYIDMIPKSRLHPWSGRLTSSISMYERPIKTTARFVRSGP